MSTNFSWTIENMLCEKQLNGHNNVVTAIFYRCTGDDGNNKISFDGVCQIPFKSGNFTDFESLTQQQIWDWIDAQKIDRETLQKGIQTELDKKKITPPVMMTPPWVKP